MASSTWLRQDLAARAQLPTRLLPIIRAIRRRHQKSGKVSGQAGTDDWIPIRPANWLLTSIFAGEAGRLVRAVGSELPAYKQGASLVAVLQKEPKTGI